jgi:uncharacterized protein (TIGR00369 family)
MPAMPLAEFEALCRDVAPFCGIFGFRVEGFDEAGAVVRMPFAPALIRPGGTIAGPALMALADFAVYAALLARIGRVPLAVTTSLNIYFLRKAAAVDVMAEARLLKLGRRLAVGEVTIAAVGADHPAAHVTATYAIPPHAVS